MFLSENSSTCVLDILLFSYWWLKFSELLFFSEISKQAFCLPSVFFYFTYLSDDLWASLLSVLFILGDYLYNHNNFIFLYMLEHSCKIFFEVFISTINSGSVSFTWLFFLIMVNIFLYFHIHMNFYIHWMVLMNTNLYLDSLHI